MTTTTTITLPAYEGDASGETVTLTAPESWHDRIRALAPHLVYGPEFRKGTLSALLSMSAVLRRGDTLKASMYLSAAERRADAGAAAER